MVAERLGYEVIDHNLSATVAHEFNVPERKLSWTLTGARGVFDGLTHDWEKNFVLLRTTIAELLQADDKVFWGPAAYLIPQQITHVLRVEVDADQGYRVQRAMEQEGVSAAGAASYIEKNAQDLQRWSYLVQSHVPWDAFFFDMKISIPPTTVARAVDIICKSIGSDTFKPTDASRQVIQDLELAAAISVALLKKGKYSIDVTAFEGKVKVMINQGAGKKGALAQTMQSLRNENIEDDVLEICAGMDKVVDVEVRPGAVADRSLEHQTQEPEDKGLVTPTIREDPALEEGSDGLPRMLLVDDDVELVAHLAKRFRARGYPIVTTGSGEEAIEVAQDQTFDVAVVDLRMPGVDGIETLRHLKRIQPMLQVIMLTGHGDVDSAFDSGQLDAVRLRRKPYPFAKLLEDIDVAKGRRIRAQRSAYEQELHTIIMVNRSSRSIEDAKEHLKTKYHH